MALRAAQDAAPPQVSAPGHAEALRRAAEGLHCLNEADDYPADPQRVALPAWDEGWVRHSAGVPTDGDD